MTQHGTQRVRALATAPSWIGDLMQRRPVVAALGLVALTVAAHLIILATPGFFSHDEWQKFDHIRLHGFGNFALAYGEIKAGPYFGYPMRPLGFLQQGVASLWMESAPPLAHLVGVANHAVVALLFVWVLRRAGVARPTAGIAGILFVLSPLTTMATGWMAASFDQLYVMFLLLGAALVVRLPDERLSAPRAAGLALAAVAALLSKEAAIAAPMAVLLLGCLARVSHPDRCPWRPFGIAFVVVLVPVAAYLLLRAPAIAASLAGQTDPAYAPALGNAPGNLWRFFSFPFRLRLVEMSANVFRSPWQPLAAAAVHSLLVGAVGWLFGLRFALAYVAGYFVFLLPPLTLPNPGAHMLYASALPMSLAIAATLGRLLAVGHRRAAVLVLAGVVALYAHDVAIQLRLYRTGVCQARFLADVDRLLAQQPPGSQGLVVVPEDGELSGVAVRAVAGREPYMRDGKPIVTFDAPDQQAGSATTRVRMTAGCALRPPPI
jgi:hypothetical protein